MIRLLSIGPCALLLSGCMTGDETIDRVFDPCARIVLAPAPDVTDQELDIVRSGLAMWSEVATNPFDIERDATSPQIAIRFADAALLVLGAYEDERAEVFINRRLAREVQAVTVAHELGHAMGLQHIEDRASVMNRANETVLPNGEDRSALEAIWGDCAAR
jgi:hypothetical protein